MILHSDSPTESALPLGCGPFAPVSDASDSLRLTIFERIRAEGAVSRAKIAKDLAISPASVTTQTSALIDLGFVQEKPLAPEQAETSRGRPPIGLSVRPDAHLVAGIKLSENKHTAVICDFAGRQLASETLAPSGHNAPEQIIAETATLVQAVCSSAGLTVDHLSCIGLGVPGFINSNSGIVHWSPLVEVADVNLAEQISDRLGCLTLIDNDANLVALAELWFGVGREISDFAVVTIEHGVGMGLVVDHKLYSGARGMGMELGHMKVALDGALCRCGQRGCLEAYVADYALVREAVAATRTAAAGTSVQSILETLYQDAKSGNLAAQSIFERAGRYLALGMGNVVNLFDPQLIILSGERMQYDYLYSDDIIDEMKRHALNTRVAPPRVEVHAWGDLLWASGAAAMALSHVTEQTLSEPVAVL